MTGNILEFTRPRGPATPTAAQIIDREIAYLQALRGVVCGGSFTPAALEQNAKHYAAGLNGTMQALNVSAAVPGSNEIPALILVAYRYAMGELACAAAALTPPVPAAAPYSSPGEKRSNTDMPHLILRANLNEMEEAAKCGVAAMWRYASGRDAIGYLMFDRPDGRSFLARPNKRSVTVWSQQDPMSNPFKTGRSKP